MFTVVWVLCVCTCACVLSCLNSGYCSTLVLDLGLHRHLDCIVHLDLNFILAKNKVAGTAVPECIPPGSAFCRADLEAAFGLYLEPSMESKVDCQTERHQQGREESRGASLSFASAPPCTLYVHDGWSTP